MCECVEGGVSGNGSCSPAGKAEGARAGDGFDGEISAAEMGENFGG